MTNPFSSGRLRPDTFSHLVTWNLAEREQSPDRYDNCYRLVLHRLWGGMLRLAMQPVPQVRLAG